MQQRAVASPVFVASLVDAIGALREIMIPSAQVSRAGTRREGFLFGLGGLVRATFCVYLEARLSHHSPRKDCLRGNWIDRGLAARSTASPSCGADRLEY
jgi:hypothetical protein